MIEANPATNLVIRPVQPVDAVAVNAIAAHPLVARTLLQLPTKELVQTENLLREQKPGLHRFVAVQEGEIVGSVNLSQQQNPRRIHSGSLGIMVHPERWGQGIGTALMNAIIDLADNWLNLKRVELGVRPDNVVAVHLYENFGFQREGIKSLADFADGRYQDQLVMARLPSTVPQIEPLVRPQYTARQDVQSITIRPAKTSDAADLHEIFIHPGVGQGTNQLPSREISVTIDWLKQQNPGTYRFSAVAKHNSGFSKTVGILTMHQHQKPRQLHAGWFGMSVHPQYWGLGVGSRLLESALDLADNWLGLKRLELEVLTDNRGAIHLYQKYGFEREGTKRLYSFGAGRWADAYFMARLAPGIG